MNEENSAIFVWVGATLLSVMAVVAFRLPALMLPMGVLAVPMARLVLAASESVQRKIAAVKANSERKVASNKFTAVVCAE